MDQAGKAVAGGATDAGAVGHILLVQQDAAGRMKGMVTSPGQVVIELLDARLIGDRWVGILHAVRWVGWVVAMLAVHLVELFGPAVVGLELFIGDGPGGGDAVVVAQLPEVFFAQSIERGAVHLGGPTDKVVDLGLKGLTPLVIPGIG